MTDFQELSNRTDLTELSAVINSVKNEISKVIVGQKELLHFLLVALLSDGHVLIEGVPGVAKTLSAKLLAKSINVPFSRIQFTPDLMPSDILGTTIFNSASNSFEFRKGPIFSNVILIDEINRAPAKTQSALFEVMEERQISMDGQQFKMDSPFVVLATQNPIEHEGTYQLPEAQLDRFLLKLIVPYPNEEEEIKLLERLQNKSLSDAEAEVKPVLLKEQLRNCRSIIKELHVEKNLLSYITKLVQLTRNHPDVFLGASPRASLALVAASKTNAAINGRDFVTPEDIKKVALPVLRHRIILNPERELEGWSTDNFILRLIKELEVPR